MTTTLHGHTDVVCPPNQYAECICGDQLTDHRPAGVDSLPYADADCDTVGAFTLAAGDSTDCPDVGHCTICDVDICVEHSTQFTSCVDGGGLHHWDCSDRCWPCSYEVGQEARAERMSDR